MNFLLYRQDEEAIERYYRERYETTMVESRFGEGEQMSNEISQQALLPGIK